jgi:hypothetical protein
MSISVGGINLVESTLDAEYRLSVLEQIVEHLINRAVPGTLTPADLSRFQDQALKNLQTKYPQAGIQRKPK